MNFGKLVGLVVLLLSIFLLWQIRFVILLAFTSISLATALNRIVQWLTNWKLSRRSAVIITLLSLLGLIVVTVTIIVPPFLEQVDQWLTQVPTESARIRIWLENINSRVPPVLAEQFQQLNAFIQEIPNIARGLFNNFFRIFSSTLSILINSFLVLAVTIMLLANPKAYRRAFISIFPQFYRHRVQDILDHCEKALVGWGIGICFNMVVISLMSFIGLVIIQVPLPIGNAMIAGVLTFIPNIGPILSVIPPAVLGVLDSPWKAIAVIGLYILIQQVESNFLTPLVMKHQVSLLPAITLVSQLICGVLFGFLGLFLALPLVVTGQVLLQELLVKDIMDNWRKPSPSGNSPPKKIVATY
ncbi:MAG: AI-2E family transporter [Cyanobacteria bacterium J06614_10]